MAPEFPFHLGHPSRDDLLRLVSKLYVNVPHIENRDQCNLMYPMSVKDGNITFIGNFPSIRSGVWYPPFAKLAHDKSEFELDLLKYGPRDLGPFRTQELSAEERFELWQQFRKKDPKLESEQKWLRDNNSALPVISMDDS